MRRSQRYRGRPTSVAAGVIKEDIGMLYWALVFFIVAIVAAVFGFGGIASAAGGIAQILFFVFVVLFLVSLLLGISRRGRVV